MGNFYPPAPGLPVSTPTISTPGAGSVTPPKITRAGAGGGGTGDMSMGFGGGGLDFSGVTFNIDAGLISSPATVGQDIIDAILAAQRNSGTVFAPAT